MFIPQTPSLPFAACALLQTPAARLPRKTSALLKIPTKITLRDMRCLAPVHGSRIRASLTPTVMLTTCP